jgi:hypothetical protein
MTKRTCKLGHSTTVSGLHRCASDRRVRGAAVSRWIEGRPGLSIRKFVRPGCRYRIIETQAGDYIITGADPVPVISMKPSSHTPLSRYAEIEPSRPSASAGRPPATRIGCTRPIEPTVCDLAYDSRGQGPQALAPS